MGPALERVFRTASVRIVGALAARFRDLDLAEDAFSEACVKAAAAWPEDGAPSDPPAWLYRVAERAALDALRRRNVRERLAPDPPPPQASAEQMLMREDRVIPDERLRLIFICCHPAVAPDARAALTLRLVCGLSTSEIARAFLLTEATLAQRLVRAKHKIAAAGVSFETPQPAQWSARMEAVLSTLEVAYSRAHEDAEGGGAHASYAAEMLRLSRLLVELAPQEGQAHALAALLHYAEARRPARVDRGGVMIPLAEQDPSLWRRDLIVAADGHFAGATRLTPDAPRTLQAALQGAWCARVSLHDPAPWPHVLELYDQLLALRDDAVVRLNRAVALSYVQGPSAALAAIETLDASRLSGFPPWHAVRADLLARLGRRAEAAQAYCEVLALEPAPAERRWIEWKLAQVAMSGGGLDRTP